MSHDTVECLLLMNTACADLVLVVDVSNTEGLQLDWHGSEGCGHLLIHT